MFQPSAISPAATGAEVFKTSPKPLLKNVATLLIVLFALHLMRTGGHLAAPSVTPQLILAGVALAALIVASLWSLIRPITLITSGSGFALAGGLRGSSEVRRWSDIERFLVVATARGDRVACILKPNAQAQVQIPKGARAELIFAGFRPAHPDQVVAELNKLRQRAVGYSPTFTDNSSSEGPDDQSTGVWPVEPKTIQASPPFYAITLAILLMPIVLFAWGATKNGLFAASVLAIILAPFMLRYLWLALYPPILTLNGTGFTYPRGWGRSPETVPWRDIQNFAVYEPMSSRGYNMPRIAYFYRPDIERTTGLLDFLSFSPQQIVPWFYVNNVEGVVAQLNDYRQRALGIAG